jgi:hypothetical protein
MSKLLEDALNSIKGKNFKLVSSDLHSVVARSVSLKAYCNALEDFIISSLAELKNEECGILKEQFDDLLAEKLSDEFSQFLSDKKREME